MGVPSRVRPGLNHRRIFILERFRIRLNINPLVNSVQLDHEGRSPRVSPLEQVSVEDTEHVGAGSTGPDPDVLADAAATFAMLASEQRLHLLWLLARHEYDVSTLARVLGVSTSLVSQHLGKMRWAGLVSTRRRGKHQLYTVDDPHVVSLVDQAIAHHVDLRSRADERNPT